MAQQKRGLRRPDEDRLRGAREIKERIRAAQEAVLDEVMG